MGVLVQRTPVRAATYRGVRTAIWVISCGAGLVTAIATASFGGLILAPMLLFCLLYACQVYYPEPALDEWDKIPRIDRIAMIKAWHPAAIQLGRYDRDWEIKTIWSRTMRGK
ncbi:UNVERIFIED_ORG: hypothetical protein J2X79_003708 [Arthrobacter globiformis]|jgi:hypothetical protein|uniref:hypothetical protein n=1 Tax=Arthrobacter sp. UNC362MFTsu5.1 TaxID=1449044 RepID=UPI00048A19DC|nr:hypothetical protein [Arthrobacter sp. UNC362MFTsu5.1]MDP9696129.1 hypothetical protein [Arthrobacter globiformis]